MKTATAAASSRSPAHRYKIGEHVSLARGFGYARKPGAIYEVTALLPSDTAHFQYRIRAQSEAYDRVAAENELAPPRRPKEG
jgi:hypothetical protein